MAIDALAPFPRLCTMAEYYDRLAEQLAKPPTRYDLDPVQFYTALPSVALVELFRDEGRLRFRVVGQDILERIGAIGLGGRWLDSLVPGDNGDAIDGLFGNLISIDKVTFEQGEVHRKVTRTVTAYAKLTLPLAAPENEPHAALVGIVFIDPFSTKPRRY
ncbi:MAG: PAS domain-containing protein [Pseudomonadota bacterium]